MNMLRLSYHPDAPVFISARQIVAVLPIRENGESAARSAILTTAGNEYRVTEPAAAIVFCMQAELTADEGYINVNAAWDAHRRARRE